MLRLLCVLVAGGAGPALPTTLALRAQSPAMPTLAVSPQMRFVDFSKDLDRNGITVVLGKLGKCKEGKRERLADGQLGGAGAGESGEWHPILQGACASLDRREDHPLRQGRQAADQLRRPAGATPRRQGTTPGDDRNGAALEDDMLALWVLAPRAKGKGLQLLHVIPFDKKVDKGPYGELQFGDAMSDYYTVNRRVDVTTFAPRWRPWRRPPTRRARKKQLAALRELLEQKVGTAPKRERCAADPARGPLEARAQKRLAEDAAAAAKRKAATARGRSPGS